MLEKFLRGGVNVRGVFVLGGNCPGGICPGVIVRGVIVRGVIVLIPVHCHYISLVRNVCVLQLASCAMCVYVCRVCDGQSEEKRGGHEHSETIRDTGPTASRPLRRTVDGSLLLSCALD